MSEIITMLIATVIILIFIQIALFIFKRLFLNRSSEEEEDNIASLRTSDAQKKGFENFGKFHGVLKREDIRDFLGFDDIEDQMIVRKGGKEYVMVLQCSGVNFDLRSENEKLAIEEGFLQFLNVLKYPIQLYIQTRSLNFSNALEQYKSRIAEFEAELEEIEVEYEKARQLGDKEQEEKLFFERQKAINIFEYAEDSLKYTEILNKNKNVLQQRTYLVISYNVEELGPKISEYNQEEIKNLVFDELVTRAEGLAGALLSSSVTAKILNSEELVELLFNAFNRDELENIDLNEYLRKEADTLYTKSEDFLAKRRRLLEKQINVESIKLASESIIKADKMRKARLLKLQKEKKERIREMAKRKLEGKKGILYPETYSKAKEMIEESNIVDPDNFTEVNNERIKHEQKNKAKVQEGNKNNNKSQNKNKQKNTEKEKQNQNDEEKPTIDNSKFITKPIEEAKPKHPKKRKGKKSKVALKKEDDEKVFKNQILDFEEIEEEVKRTENITEDEMVKNFINREFKGETK